MRGCINLWGPGGVNNYRTRAPKNRLETGSHLIKKEGAGWRLFIPRQAWLGWLNTQIQFSRFVIHNGHFALPPVAVYIFWEGNLMPKEDFLALLLASLQTPFVICLLAASSPRGFTLMHTSSTRFGSRTTTFLALSYGNVMDTIHASLTAQQTHFSSPPQMTRELLSDSSFVQLEKHLDD